MSDPMEDYEDDMELYEREQLRLDTVEDRRRENKIDDNHEEIK